MIHKFFKKLSFRSFKENLLDKMVACNNSYDEFDKNFRVYNKHASKKTK